MGTEVSATHLTFDAPRREVAGATTSSSMRVNNFDLIRVFAALQVVISHGSNFLHVTLWHPLAELLDFVPGVPVFFVVSGFLISLSWERAPSARNYLRNRLLRIYPALWVCLAVSIGIFLIAGVRPDSVPHFLVWILAQSTIVQFYNPDFLRGFGIGVLNGSLWTIPVELQFYLLLPFLAIFARRRPSRWIALTFAAGVVMMLARIWLPGRETLLEKLVGVTIVPYLFYFLVGVVSRYLFERRPGLFVGRGLLWAALYAAWAMIEVRLSIGGADGNLLNPFSILLIAAMTVSLAFSARTASSRFLRGNDVSYGLYIYHAPVMNILVSHHVSGGAGFVLFVASTISLAILSWRLVEKPALALKDTSLRPVG